LRHHPETPAGTDGLGDAVGGEKEVAVCGLEPGVKVQREGSVAGDQGLGVVGPEAVGGATDGRSHKQCGKG
jgi:hypothetical protein